MKKVALVFVLAVLLPSLVLAWLAVRSLRDQQFLLERQQSLLDQHVTDTLAQSISDYLAQRQQEFGVEVESLAGTGDPRTAAAQFDDQLRQRWPLAEVGFCVTLSGQILSPASNARPAAQMFRLDNSGFLGNREPVEVYLNANSTRNGGQYSSRNSQNQSFALNGASSGSLGGGNDREGQGAQNQVQQTMVPAASVVAPSQEKPALVNSAAAPNAGGQSYAANNFPNRSLGGGGGGGGGGGRAGGGGFGGGQVEQKQAQPTLALAAPGAAPPQSKTEFASAAASMPEDKIQSAQPQVAAASDTISEPPAQIAYTYKAAQARNVSPQSEIYQALKDSPDDAKNNLSKVIPAEAEFSQLIGGGTDGMLARFLQNQLKLLFWHRLNREPDLIFGAQLNLDRVVDGLRDLVQTEPALRDEICLALLDDNARPVVISRAGFQANWKHPFVATEVGDALPHWEVAAYLVNPAQLTQAAHTARFTLGLLIALLVLAIGVGSWLIVSSLNSELKLARQKTDFVSNVSHELKTPLTSIRMFSELLAEGRVTDVGKQRSYLNIITAEAARLARLINNVLDFSRMERGEKKYNFQPCDLTEVVRSTAETFRPHLEAGGFKFDCELPDAPVSVRGDADALSQVIVNLLSNAEKYSNGGKEITLQLGQKQSPLPYVEVRVLDRGSGVPRGSEEKIFEKFYRAHDSLSSGIQGSGLGLTIARQIARAHGGDVVHEPREGGGSCFILRLPISTTDKHG
jgi:signal transduction histidine kinase